jgi:hypothetical protein
MAINTVDRTVAIESAVAVGREPMRTEIAVPQLSPVVVVARLVAAVAAAALAILVLLPAAVGAQAASGF